MKTLRGDYSYRRNGELQDIQEPWTWQFDGDTSVLSGQRIVAGVPVLDIRAEYHGPRCVCLLYTSPSPRDLSTSRMPSSA